jgi:epoxyqueuosine reductase
MLNRLMAIVTELSKRIKAHGFEQFGFVPLKRPLSMDLYYEWLRAGNHAGMDYLVDHAVYKENPKILNAKARSAIVLAINYADLPSEGGAQGGLRTALYARIKDYHGWLIAKLEALASDLRDQYISEEFLCYTDNKPIAERDLAVQAGIGWVGKNGCVLNRQNGSFFFLSEIFTSLELDAGFLSVSDHCGTCDRCLKACPTQALREDRTLDARLCISYLNIEAKEDPPEDLRQKMGDWFFGCDICQSVCPWNEKVYGRERMREHSVPLQSNTITEELRWCLTASNRQIQRAFYDSPLLRAKGRGLKRNALIVIGNRKITELRPEVAAIAEEQPRLHNIAVWTLRQLDK